jgi:hypothetical protein
MWRRVDLVWTDVSEGRTASIFRVEKSANEEPARAGADCSHLLSLVPRSLIFVPWRWKRYVPPKRRFTQALHGATSQKTAYFIDIFPYARSLPKIFWISYWSHIFHTHARGLRVYGLFHINFTVIPNRLFCMSMCMYVYTLVYWSFAYVYYHVFCGTWKPVI